MGNGQVYVRALEVDRVDDHHPRHGTYLGRVVMTGKTKPCPDCGGPMFHKKDYRSTPWNVSHAPSLLWELWVCMDCQHQKSVQVKEDGSIETGQRGRE